VGASIPYPNAVYNQIVLIKMHLQRRGKDLEGHVHTMFEYDLDYIMPSHHFKTIIDAHLSDIHCAWRIHTMYANSDTLKARTVLRHTGLEDMVYPPVSFEPYEKQLFRIMEIYATQFDEPLISRASSIDVDETDCPGVYRWKFRRYFDAWIYDALRPKLGWVHDTSR